MSELVLQLLANGISTGMGYALVALSLSLVFGVLHVVNFAQGEVFMVGAFSALLATRAGVPYLAALPLAVVAGLVVGLLLDWICVRSFLARSVDRTEVLLSTFAASILLYEGVLFAGGSEPADVAGVQGLFHAGPVVVSAQRLFIVGAGIVILLALEWMLKRTRLGVEMRAVAQSAFAANLVGIRTRRVQSITFVVSAAIGALAGALLAPAIFFSPTMGQAVLIKAFVVVVIGGLGSIRGAVVFGLLLGVSEAIAALFASEAMANAGLYAAMLLVLLWRPNGLLGKTA